MNGEPVTAADYMESLVAAGHDPLELSERLIAHVIVSAAAAGGDPVRHARLVLDCLIAGGWRHPGLDPDAAGG